MSQEEFIISFPVALPGFPELTRYRLFEPQGVYPVKFLQSIDDPAVSFVCMDAATFKKD